MSATGAFVRQPSRFRRWVSEAETGRYHLYVARACPWAHRTIIGRMLMGLEDAVTISFIDPIRDERGWRLYDDEVNGFEFLSEAYEATEPGYDGRVSVPVLWDRERSEIVNNESADILRMFGTVFAPLAEHPVELCPEPLRGEIDALGEHIYETVNDGVYRAGFARSQEAYERAVHGIFASLDELDGRLTARRFLFGERPLETDWRLFTTLVRFDAVYQIHFKCSLRKLTEYEHLWPYVRDLYQWPGVAATVDFDEIRAHYYRTHAKINPSGIVAVMPADDFTAPHHRG